MVQSASGTLLRTSGRVRMKTWPSGFFARVVLAALAAASLLVLRAEAASVDSTALSSPASAPTEAEVQWKDIEIRARLDGDGVLHVTELVWLEAIGDVTTVERFVRGWVGTGVQVSRVARIEASGREARVLSQGSLDAADRYEWVDGQSLRWSVRGPQEAAFAAVTRLGYRIEYTVSGAVIPIWGVRPFSSATILSLFVLHPVRRGEELWQAWRFAPGAWRSRYLVDHDFSPFPFLATTTVDRVSLLMAFDRAWGGQEAPFREWRPVPAGGDARQALPLDFRGTGVPAAIDPTLHMSWLGPLGLLPLVSVALWAGLVFRQWRRRRRFDHTPVDASWMGLHLVTRAPDEIAQVLSGPDEGFSYPGAAAILERMARQMKIEFHDEPDRGTLRLRVPRASLTPWERAIVEQLFGVGDVVEEPAVRSRLEAGTIDPEGAARRAYETARLRRTWRFSPRAVPTLVLIALGVGLMLTVLAAGGFQALAVGLVLGSVIYQPMRPAAARWGRRPDLPLFPLGALIVPALVFSAALIVFFLSVPAYPRAIIGLASLWLGLTNSLVNGAKPLGSESEIEARYGLARARRYIAAELRKPFPNLEDTWLPWILALDLGDEVAAWRERKPTDPSQVPDPEAYAFMGRWRGGSVTAPSMTRWAARFLATPRA